NKKVWWKCENGHEWRATIASRSNGCGCPVCLGRRPMNSKLI
ncbi:MAG: zinc-ribbon domain-containing protein, partial [Lachnospiraceae bacterium]|nr:zinc-ribbon domain-containing protein [Lachnospiraceae bacterium]